MCVNGSVCVALQCLSLSLCFLMIFCMRYQFRQIDTVKNSPYVYDLILCCCLFNVDCSGRKAKKNRRSGCVWVERSLLAALSTFFSSVLPPPIWLSSNARLWLERAPLHYHPQGRPCDHSLVAASDRGQQPLQWLAALDRMLFG